MEATVQVTVANDEDVKEVEVTDDMPGTQNTDRARLSKNEEIASFNLDD